MLEVENSWDLKHRKVMMHQSAMNTLALTENSLIIHVGAVECKAVLRTFTYCRRSIYMPIDFKVIPYFLVLGTLQHAFYIRMLKISWRDLHTNDKVLRKSWMQLELIATIEFRKTAYLGHKMCENKYYPL